MAWSPSHLVILLDLLSQCVDTTVLSRADDARNTFRVSITHKYTTCCPALLSCVHVLSFSWRQDWQPCAKWLHSTAQQRTWFDDDLVADRHLSYREGEGPVKPPPATPSPDEEDTAVRKEGEEREEHQASAVPTDADQDSSTVADQVVDKATTAGG